MTTPKQIRRRFPRSVFPFRIKDPGWYAITSPAESRPEDLISPGPYRTEEEVLIAIANCYARPRYSNPSRWSPQLQGPYPTRAKARMAHWWDGYPKQAIYAAGKPPLKSARADGRGHWPGGKHRNNGQVSKRWSSWPHFLHWFAAEFRWRPLRVTAHELGVSTSALSRYLRREVDPPQAIIDRMEALYNQRQVQPAVQTPSAP